MRVRQRGTFEDGAARLVITGPAEAVALIEGYTFTLADGLPLVLRRVEVVPPPDDGTPRLGDGATTGQAAEGVLAVARGVPLDRPPGCEFDLPEPGVRA